MEYKTKMCPKCNNNNNSSYTKCWKCGTAFDGKESDKVKANEKIISGVGEAKGMNDFVGWCIGIAAIIALAALVYVLVSAKEANAHKICSKDPSELAGRYMVEVQGLSGREAGTRLALLSHAEKYAVCVSFIDDQE